MTQVRTLDLASLGLLVQALGVTLFTFFNASIDKYLDKRKSRVMLRVKLASKVAISLVWRNERRDSNGRRRGEQKGNLISDGIAYLGNTTNVLLAVLGREAKVLVQAEANVVAIQTERRLLQVQQVLLERRGDRRLARSRKTSEPNRHTLLVQKRAPLIVSNVAGVESNVRGHDDGCSKAGCYGPRVFSMTNRCPAPYCCFLRFTRALKSLTGWSDLGPALPAIEDVAAPRNASLSAASRT